MSHFHDAQVTWQKYHEQWTNQQNKMRLKVKIEDMFDWEVPTNVKVRYYKNNTNFGIVEPQNKNISVRRIKKINQENKNKKKFNHDDNKQNDNNKKNKKVELKYIGGVDISATSPGAFEYDKACAGLMVYEYPSMRLIHEETEIVTLKHPYIAGFLAFREVTYLIKLFNKIKKKKPKILPQLILVDGNGILHYRRTGLATHLSMRIGIPCIGIAKKLLAVDNMNVEYMVPQLTKGLNKVGHFSKIHGFNNEQIGFAMRTHPNLDVVYISPGHMISFETTLKMVILCMDKQQKYKLPLPTEKADFVTRKHIKRYQKENINTFDKKHENMNKQNDDQHQKQQQQQQQPKTQTYEEYKRQLNEKKKSTNLVGRPYQSKRTKNNQNNVQNSSNKLQKNNKKNGNTTLTSAANKKDNVESNKKAVNKKKLNDGNDNKNKNKNNKKQKQKNSANSNKKKKKKNNKKQWKQVSITWNV